MFNRLFGQSTKTDIPVNVNESIQIISSTDLTLGKRIAHLEKQVNKLESEAKAFIKIKTKSNKQKALHKLRLKNMKMKEIDKLMNMQYNLSVQRSALENASMNTLVVKSIKTANNTVKDIQKQTNIDTVEELVDDLAEQHGLLNEVSDALSQPFFNNGDDDEDELLAELDEFEELEDDKKLNLPTCPTSNLLPINQEDIEVIEETEEDKELKELESMMI